MLLLMLEAVCVLWQTDVSESRNANVSIWCQQVAACSLRNAA